LLTDNGNWPRARGTTPRKRGSYHVKAVGGDRRVSRGDLPIKITDVFQKRDRNLYGKQPPKKKTREPESTQTRKKETIKGTPAKGRTETAFTGDYRTAKGGGSSKGGT